MSAISAEFSSGSAKVDVDFILFPKYMVEEVRKISDQACGKGMCYRLRGAKLTCAIFSLVTQGTLPAIGPPGAPSSVSP